MSFARDIATVGSGALMSRLLAFARDALIASMLGAGPFSEAFFVVLQIINFFRRLLAEGALNGAFVPLWLKLRAGENGAANADRFTKRTLVMMLSAAGTAALLANIFAHWLVIAIAPGFDPGKQALAALLLSIAAPYIFFAGVVAVIAAALNAEGRVAATTISTVVFNVVMVATAVLLLDREIYPFEKTVLLASAIVVAAIAQLFITGLTWILTGKRWQRSEYHVPDETRALFVRAVPGLVGAGIPQLKLIAGAAIASASPAAVAWLYYANRLYELPLGIASVAIAAVIVPRIASSVRAADGAVLAAAQSRAFEIALGLSLPAATGFAVLATPIAGGLFQRGAFTATDTAAVAAALTAICAGLPGHVLEKAFAAVSFAHEDTRTPMLTALAALAAAVLGALLLFPRYGHTGVAAAIGISAWVGAALLGLTLYRRGWLRLDRNGAGRLPRIVLATAIMGAVVMLGRLEAPAATPSSASGIAILLGLVALGVIVYAAALQLFAVVNVRDLLVAVRRNA
ncbi:MAG TPA: murein biosynthesis integral membrane protein MurJ [Pseudolabrys sp.]|nr:murein biosynthesis integral membrane protein MurJ [Pseudolabrys sp.]